MKPRERVRLTLEHQEPDRVPLDVGGTPVTGMHVSSVYGLRQHLALDAPGEPVKVTNIYQMLGEIKPDLAEALGVDVIPLPRPKNSFGIDNRDWKEWTTPNGTPVLVPGGFNTDPGPDGDILMYPQGNKDAAPSGRMPAGGYYFDAIERQPPLDDQTLRVEDNLEEFGPLSAEELDFFRREAERLHAETDMAVVANMGGTGFGDVAHVPGVHLRNPQGVRSVQEWYLSLVKRPAFVHELFERQCAIALDNLERFHEAVGDRAVALFVSGTDFGGQENLLISPRTYRELFKPFHRRINDWIHEHTSWKSFMHTDGSVSRLLPDFAEAGFDILNPVQWTAKAMNPTELKERFGAKFTFWGAGIDTQKTLPFGTPDEVREEVRRQIETFGPGGGFVFASVHNVQAEVPVENLLALFEAFCAYGRYPLVDL